MDSLVELCKSLSSDALFGLGEKIDANECSSTPPARLDRLLWTMCKHVCRAQNQLRRGARNTTCQRTVKCLQDFFQLSLEQFLGRYLGALSRLTFSDRRLLVSVKMSLSYALDVHLPAASGKADFIATDNEHPFPTRSYFTVASMVPCTTEDFRKILTGNSKRCSCRKNQGPNACSFCQRSKLMEKVEPRKAFALGEMEQCGLYDRPNPYSLLRALSFAGPCDTSEDACNDEAIVLEDNFINAFRRQTVQTNLDAIVKRCRLRDVAGASKDENCPPRLEKFRTSDLPEILRPNFLLDIEPVRANVDYGDETLTLERDLGTLLAHFSVNWGKLHFFEPSVIPQFSQQ